eukprot:3897465-Pleurochrysis_carterae.AAC.1
MAAKPLAEPWRQVCHQGVACDQLRRFRCWRAEDALVEKDASNSFRRRKLRKIFVRGHVHVLALSFDSEAGVRSA